MRKASNGDQLALGKRLSGFGAAADASYGSRVSMAIARRGASLRSFDQRQQLKVKLPGAYRNGEYVWPEEKPFTAHEPPAPVVYRPGWIGSSTCRLPRCWEPWASRFTGWWSDRLGRRPQGFERFTSPAEEGRSLPFCLLRGTSLAKGLAEMKTVGAIGAPGSRLHAPRSRHRATCRTLYEAKCYRNRLISRHCPQAQTAHKRGDAHSASRVRLGLEPKYLRELRRA
jgi:hypothetical protein